MINAILIDDEAHCIDRLNNLLIKYCPNIQVVAFSSDIDSAFDKIRKLKPKAIFLDVQIHDKTGFDLLAKFHEINFHVIFTTAFEHFAVQAFKFSAVDYLLKPIDPDDLIQSVEKLNQKIESKEKLEDLSILQQNLVNFQTQNKKLIVPTVLGFEFLNVQDIIHCQSDVNYTTLFLKNHKKLTVAKTLKEFEELLQPYNFFRVHNSHLINLEYVKSYNKGKSGIVKMTDDTEIEVSSRRKDGFLQKLSEM